MANILVIDEDREQRTTLVNLCQQMNHSVTEAWDGSNAVHKADQNTYDLIVSCYQLTKITIGNFLKALRLAKLNRFTPVILYHSKFDEEIMSALGRFGRIQFINSPIPAAAFKDMVATTIQAAEAAQKERQNQNLKVYTFSKASLESCNKCSVDNIATEFFSFYPGMLEQVDSSSIDFGIWLKGSKHMLEYISTKFTPEENTKHINDIIGALKRLKGAVQLFVRNDEKQKLYDHVAKVRQGKLAAKGLRDNQKEVSDLFDRLTMCASRFISGDVDASAIVAAEQISMDMMQRLSDKAEVLTVLIDLLRKDPQMYDFVSLVTVSSVAIGRKLGLQDSMLKRISLGCLFHDVGLASLNLPLVVDRKMTIEEHSLYRDHPSAGADELNALEARGIALPEEVFIITMQHHEKFNGTGFPNQKKGRLGKDNPNGIHLLASIVSIADRFASYLLTESKAGNIDQVRIVTAINRLQGEFDPAVLKAFSEVFATSKTTKVDWQMMQ